MIVKNYDIRRAAKDEGVRLWQVGEEMGITDSNFSRLLRRELDTETREKVLGIIEQLKKGE